VAYHMNLDALPAFQNVAVTYDELFATGAELNFTDLRRSIGAVDDESGYLWSVFGHMYSTLGDWYPGSSGVSTSAAAAARALVAVAAQLRRRILGRPGQPLANAYFGAFGNNYVDDGEAKRYATCFACRDSRSMRSRARRSRSRCSN